MTANASAYITQQITLGKPSTIYPSDASGLRWCERHNCPITFGRRKPILLTGLVSAAIPLWLIRINSASLTSSMIGPLAELVGKVMPDARHFFAHLRLGQPLAAWLISPLAISAAHAKALRADAHASGSH
jgi:hypothetical protein